MANDNTMPVINDFMMGNINEETALLLLKPQKLKNQYAFTHKMLEDDELKMWYFSPQAVYDMWENEILAMLDKRKLTDFVYDMYEMYHSEAIDNAFRDLDSLISTGNPA